MISEAAANSDSQERILLYDMWKMLDGEKEEEVKLEDLKTLIMAILRFTETKRIGLDPLIKESEGV